MFHPTASASASRALLRSLNAASQRSSARLPIPLHAHARSRLSTLARRPQPAAFAAKPLALQLLRARFADSRGPMDTINTKSEQKIGQQKLQPDPEGVSSDSSVHPVLGEVHAAAPAERETEMLAGVKADLQTIRETFSLQEVPRQAYYIGLAGVLPYVGTSLGTVYCAWEINHTATSGTGFLITDKTAELLLHILEPLQVGYGATIISFLGAIHWGLEFAKYGGEHGYPRYSIGVAAAALAWPTILLPVEYALISQFLIFNFLYYTDSRASKNGWAPHWYGVYRFVLTFVVGTAIVASLIGRGHIGDRVSRPSGPAERVRELREYQAEAEEEEEEARRKYLASGDDEEEEEEEEEGGEEEGEEEGSGEDDKE